MDYIADVTVLIICETVLRTSVICNNYSQPVLYCSSYVIKQQRHSDTILRSCFQHAASSAYIERVFS